MMKSNYGSIIRGFLTLIIAILLALTILGCQNQNEVSIAAKHRRLTSIAEQQLRWGLSAFPPTSQTETFRPAP